MVNKVYFFLSYVLDDVQRQHDTNADFFLSFLCTGAMYKGNLMAMLISFFLSYVQGRCTKET